MSGSTQRTDVTEYITPIKVMSHQSRGPWHEVTASLRFYTDQPDRIMVGWQHHHANLSLHRISERLVGQPNVSSLIVTSEAGYQLDIPSAALREMLGQAARHARS